MNRTFNAKPPSGWLRSTAFVSFLLFASLPLVIALTIYFLEPNGIVVYDELHLTGQGRFYGSGVYRHCVFGTSSTSLWALSEHEFSPDDAIPIPEIYVRLPDETTILLTEITPTLASNYWESEPNILERFPYTTFFGRSDTDLECDLIFDGDRLIAAELNGPGFALGRKQDGPFYHIPFSYRQMVELFGEPREISQRKWPH